MTTAGGAATRRVVVVVVVVIIMDAFARRTLTSRTLSRARVAAVEDDGRTGGVIDWKEFSSIRCSRRSRAETSRRADERACRTQCVARVEAE